MALKGTLGLAISHAKFCVDVVTFYPHTASISGVCMLAGEGELALRGARRCKTSF